MPLKLTAPVMQVLELEETDRTYGNEGSPTTVTIRQATQYQHEERMNLFSIMETRQAENESEGLIARTRFAPEELKRLEVYLTLADCNIEDEKGKPLFKFKDVQGQSRLAMTKQQFQESWGLLPPDVAAEIHTKVLEVNPGWTAEGEGR